MKNILLLIISVILCLLLVETGLRILTPFPINQTSNRTHDPTLGYRFSTRLGDIDKNGFRNENGKTYQIAAIGDSQTYGINVPSVQSWPSQLASMLNRSVYNFGVGSYGIFSYHAIIKTQLQPDTQAVIIGFYSANDLELDYSYCQIDKENDDFWKMEIESLHLKIPAVKHCRDRHLNKKTRTIPGLKNWLFENTAFLNAIKILVVSRLKQNQVPVKDTNKYYYFPDGIDPIAQGRARGHAKMLDLSNPDILAMYENMRIFIADWSAWSQSNGISLGVMFIPSLERVVYEYFKAKDGLDYIDPDFINAVQKQITMEEKITELLDNNKVPHKNALGKTLRAFQKSIKNEERFYPYDNGHPYAEGYRAYAGTAYELWQEMTE